MDNLLVVRGIIDHKVNSCKLRFLSVDQVKAFERVDHGYLFQALEAVGVGREFLLWLKLLYSEACFILKTGGLTQ